MYTCDRCQKSYSSEKRYDSHVERCALRDLDDDVQSVKSSRSAGSRRSNAISDIESNYRRDSRLDDGKLLREKTRLKSELKKYSRELQRVKELNRNEMEKSQEYFNQQILDLTEERNQILEELSAARNELFNEKERLRDEFNKKLTAHKEQLEKRYSSSSNKQIKHLNDMINKLQEKLDEQLEEKDKIKESLERYYNEREEKLRNEAEKYQEDNQKIRLTFENERTELKRIVDTCSIEKEAYKMKCNTERDREIQKVILDKNTAIQSLQNINESLQKRLDILESEKKKETETLKYSHQNDVRMKEHQIAEMKAQFNRKFEENTKSLKSQIELANRQVEKAVQESSRNYEKKIKQDRSQYDKVVEALKISHDKQLHDLNTELTTARADIDYQRRYTEDCIKRKEQDMLKQFQQITDKLESEKESIRYQAEKKYNEAITTHEQKFNKLQNEFNAIEEELFKNKMYVNRIKQDTEQIKSQCVLSLNRQKADTDKIIAERETHISNLESQINKIKVECKDNISRIQTNLETEKKNREARENELSELKKKYDEADRKCLNVSQNYEMRINHIKQDFATKMNTVRETVEKEFKSENIKLKVEIGRLNDVIKNIKDEYVNKLNEQKEKIQKQSSEKVTTLEKKITEFETEIKNKASYITRLEGDFLEKMNKQREHLMSEFEKEKKANPPPNYDRNLLEKEQQIARLNIDIAQIKTDFITKINEVTKERNTLKDEIISLKTNLPKDFESKYNALKSELDSCRKQFSIRIDEETKKHQNEIQKLKTEIIQKESQVELFKSRLITEQENYMQRLNNNPREAKMQENINTAREEVKRVKEQLSLKINEIDKLNRTININREQYMQQLNGITVNEPSLKKRISELEKRISELEEDLIKKSNELNMKERNMSGMNDKIEHIKKIAQEEIKAIMVENVKLKKDYEDLKKNPPNKKEIDEEYRQTRNKWMEDLKNLRHELEIYKTKYQKVNEAYVQTDAQLKDSIKLQNETQTSYLNSLNTQKEHKDSIIAERDRTIEKYERRISELEKLLSDTVTRISHSEVAD